jgi:hypothetical protein
LLRSTWLAGPFIDSLLLPFLLISGHLAV